MRPKLLTIAVLTLVPGHALAQDKPAPPQDKTPQEKPGEVTVRGTRGDVIATPDRLSFNVANDLQVQNGTIADALRNVPGVEVDLQGAVSLRGDPGVTILIDGRPSAMMRGEGRGDVLMSMPAGRIERVEVITNPSAAMSPEGSAGVINLVTKQTQPGGVSGTARVTVGGEGRFMGNLNGAYSRPGMTITGDLGYRRFTSDTSITQDRARLDPISGNFVGTRLDVAQENVMEGQMARFGIDYDPNKADRISGEYNYRNAGMEGHRIDRFTGTSPATSYDRDSTINQRFRNSGGRASWRHSFAKDHELVTDLEIETGGQFRTLRAVTTPDAGAPVYERTSNKGDRGAYGFKADYKRPLGAGKSLNLGYELDVDTARFDFTGVRGASEAFLFPVAGLNNRFDYDQAVHALYATAQLDLGTLELQPGLRIEQAEIDLNDITGGTRAAQDYLRAYPTLHLGYELSAKQKLRGSYSRRIQRPGPLELNPYVFYIDPLNLRRGNPNLLPEVTDSFELGWNMRDGGTFYSLTGFYRVSRDGVTEVFEDAGGGVLLSTRANLATGERAGVEAIANGKFSKTLSYNASATFFWNEIDRRVGGVSMPRSGSTGSVRASLNWQPTANDFIQLNGNYTGRQLLAQGYREPGGVLNFGYRRKVSDRMSVLLTGQNILDTAKQTLVIDTPTIRDRFVQRGVGRAFLIGVTYNLGNTGARRRPEPGFEFDQGGGVAQ